MITSSSTGVKFIHFHRSTIDNLLQLSIVPIINTNDAAAPVPHSKDVQGAIKISDNDSLAARFVVI